MKRSFLLINTNVARPQVSPIGLEYMGEALVDANVPVSILDLAFETDWKGAIARELNNSEPLAIGLSVRNTDDCSFATKESFLPWINEVTTEVKRLTEAPVIFGGVGFSIMPEDTLNLIQIDAGIIGDGEEVAQVLATHLSKNDDFPNIPNLVYRSKGNIIRNPRAYVDLQHLPLPRRRLFDNKRYQQQGAMVGIETKRGCPQKCFFCADPIAKGDIVRLRPPLKVVQEFQDLLDQGVSWFHLCDSEFNLPITHAKEICHAVIQAGIGNKIRWYCYCSPVPFDAELESLMKRAGCAGINFGVDSLCDEQLSRLGRNHSTSDIQKLVILLKEKNVNYIFDLLIGGPGEREETVRETIDTAKQLDIPLVGIAYGVRLYPETPFSKAIAEGSIRGGLHPKAAQATGTPVFYLSPHLGSDASALITELVAGDPRFFVLATPSEDGSYNYANDDMLCQLIADGARGAYWDILRQNRVAGV